MSSTNKFHSRSLSQADKKKIRSLLRYGDLKLIAKKCSVGYQRVSDVIRKGEDHDQIWAETVKYLNSLPEVQLDELMAKYLRKK